LQSIYDFSVQKLLVLRLFQGAGHAVDLLTHYRKTTGFEKKKDHDVKHRQGLIFFCIFWNKSAGPSERESTSLDKATFTILINDTTPIENNFIL
jgi:hypothetical protein